MVLVLAMGDSNMPHCFVTLNEAVRSAFAGMQQCSDDSNYVGDYRKGKRHGFGAYSFPNGDRYLGQCNSDMPHGYGVYMFASGQVYEGQWKFGRKHGWCVYTVETGEQWAGRFLTS